MSDSASPGLWPVSQEMLFLYSLVLGHDKGQSACSSNPKCSGEALASWRETQTGGIKTCPILQSWKDSHLCFLSAISRT